MHFQALLFWAYHLNESLYFLFARSELPWVEVLKVLPFTTSLEEHLKKIQEIASIAP